MIVYFLLQGMLLGLGNASDDAPIGQDIKDKLESGIFVIDPRNLNILLGSQQGEFYTVDNWSVSNLGNSNYRVNHQSGVSVIGRFHVDAEDCFYADNDKSVLKARISQGRRQDVESLNELGDKIESLNEETRRLLDEGYAIQEEDPDRAIMYMQQAEKNSKEGEKIAKDIEKIKGYRYCAMWPFLGSLEIKGEEGKKWPLVSGVNGREILSNQNAAGKCFAGRFNFERGVPMYGSCAQQKPPTIKQKGTGEAYVQRTKNLNREKCIELYQKGETEYNACMSLPK